MDDYINNYVIENLHDDVRLKKKKKKKFPLKACI